MPSAWAISSRPLSYPLPYYKEGLVMITRRTSAQVVPICVRVLTAPPTLFIKSHCGLNTSWTSKLASIRITFKDNQNVYYQPCGRDDLPKKIRGKARWTLLKARDWSYVIHVEGKPHSVEFINDTWYRTGWSADVQSFYTNANQRITHPEQFGLGTKEAPILSEEDQKCLQGVPITEETHNGQEERPNTQKAPGIKEAYDDQEEGPSMRRLGFLDCETFQRVLHKNIE